MRFRLGAHTPDDWRNGNALTSDRTGFVTSLSDDDLVINHESIPNSAITSVKVLSHKVIKNSTIREMLGAQLAYHAISRTEYHHWSGYTIGNEIFISPESTRAQFNSQIFSEIAAATEQSVTAVAPLRLFPPGTLPLSSPLSAECVVTETLVKDLPHPDTSLLPTQFFPAAISTNSTGVAQLEIPLSALALRQQLRHDGFQLCYHSLRQTFPT